MKKILLFCFSIVTCSTYAAQQPAVKISRANCPAPLPQWLGLPGVGYHNESISYDRLLVDHKLRVGSNQTRAGGIVRNFFYPANNPMSFGISWRGYAGKADPLSNGNMGWKVTGNHEELLDSGQYLQSNTFATGCNLTEW